MNLTTILQMQKDRSNGVLLSQPSIDKLIGHALMREIESERLTQALADSNLALMQAQEVAQAASRQAEAKQAEIDRLMLEYSPDEMSAEQISEWEAHQREVSAWNAPKIEAMAAATPDDVIARMSAQAQAPVAAIADVVKYTRLARGIQNPAGSYPNGPWEDFYACDDVLRVLAAPQQHAQAAQTEINDALDRADSEDSRLHGNDAQAALSDDRVFSIADAHADESREDGVRLLGRGGLLAFAADLLATRQPAPAKTEGCAGFQGKDVADCGPCGGAGCDAAAPVAAAAQGDAARIMQSLIEDAVANHKSPTGYVKLCMTHFAKHSAGYQQGRAAGLAEAEEACIQLEYECGVPTKTEFAKSFLRQGIQRCLKAIRALNKTEGA